MNGDIMGLTTIKKDYIVEKRNVLNEMRAKGWTLQELRFFSIYLSKINARDISTRIVRFSLDNFQRIMGLKRLQPKDIKPTIDSLLSKIVYVPLDKDGFNRGYTAFQLFKECTVSQDDTGIWHIEIDAHDKSLPLMFDFKRDYFKYQIKNILCLNGSNQHRMYEILKQHECKKIFTVTYAELRDMLGIAPHEYIDKATGKHRWNNFKMYVLDECQKALIKMTDIKYTYIAEKRGGLNKKIIFTIEKNPNYIDQLTFAEFIDYQSETELLDVADDEKETMYSEHLKFLAEACDYEFTNVQMQVIFDIFQPIHEDLVRYNVLKLHYDKMKMYAEDGSVKSRFGYLKKLLSKHISDFY
jgi:plasmid replication initiation protein